MDARTCLEAHRAALEPLRDAATAQGMSAYLLDQFSFLGIKAPVRREAVKHIVRTARSRADLLASAQLLWQQNEREYRYSAVDLLAKGHKLLRQEDVPVLITLALREPWWETVDGIGAVISDILLMEAQRGITAFPVMEEALQSTQMWQRRLAMTHQLGWKTHTDLPRLFRYALHLADEREFFIRKAIGWALRDAARSYPDEVRRFLTQHRATLSPLTIREAGKHLG